MKAAVPDATWGEVLPEVLTGICKLPRRLGFQPHLLVFKQYPNVLGSLADELPLGMDGADVYGDLVEQQDSFLSSACMWWDQVAIPRVKELLG